MTDTAYQPVDKRLQQLNVIKRFLQSNQPVMLIVGEKDSGKSNLLGDIILQLRQSRSTIRIQGTPNLHPAQLVSVLMKHWELPTKDANARIELQLDHLLTCLVEKKQNCLLVIDDGHLLSLSVLAALSHWVTQQDGKPVQLHILLTGRPILMERMSNLQLNDIPHLTIGGLTREESFRKIKRLLDRANLQLPNTAANAILNRLYDRSEGMPQLLEHLVQKLIAQRQHSEPGRVDILAELNTTPPTSVTNKLPKRSIKTIWKVHRIKLIAVLSLFAFGYAYWQLERRPTTLVHSAHVAPIKKENDRQIKAY